MAANPNPAFALNPAMQVTGVIDWNTQLGMSIDKHAPKPLSTEAFDGKQEGLPMFLKLFKLRGDQYGWFDLNRDFAIGLIAQDPNDPNNPTVYHVVDYYGSVSRDNITAHAASYLFEDQDPNCQRAQQDDHYAFRCLMNSVHPSTMSTLFLRENEYMISDPNDPDAPKKASAILLLRCLVEECTMQTNATTASIRTKLTNLHQYMLKIGSDIDKFNQYVEANVAALTARGEETTDLQVNLWKAYMVAEDKQFAEYMKRQHEQYEMSTDEMAPKAIMSTAMNKYKLLKEAGEWMEPTGDQKLMMALSAKIDGVLAKQKKEPSPSKNKRTVKFADTEKNNKKKKKNGKFTKGPDSLPPPQPDELHKVVTLGDRKYYWCSTETGGKCGGKWRAHRPSECKVKDFHKKPNSSAKHDNTNKKNHPAAKNDAKSPLLKAVAALSGTTSDSDHDE